MVATRNSLSLVQLPGFSDFAATARPSARGRESRRKAPVYRRAETSPSTEPSVGRANTLNQLGFQCIWEPLLRSGALWKRIYFATTLGLQGLPLDCGNPGLETSFFTSILAAYRSPTSKRSPRPPMPNRSIVCLDAAWHSRSPIPFVEAEAALVSAAYKMKVLSPYQFRSQLRNKTLADGAYISIACHGASIGSDDQSFSVLAIDLAKRIFISPSDFHSNAPNLKTLYLSACM